MKIGGWMPWHYGYELSRETGLKSGTLYPILMRLVKFSFLETKWVTTEDGVPPRHFLHSPVRVFCRSF
jgi:DNA-binding PadR family transcriptional regulator